VIPKLRHMTTFTQSRTHRSDPAGAFFALDGFGRYDDHFGHRDERRSTVAAQARDALMQALHAREPELGDHVRQVADLAVAVGHRLGMDAGQLDELHRAAELHDVGKIGTPDAVLYKPGPLDDDDWRVMRQHTIVGERILDSVPALRPVARIVRSSHEHWNGTGYPDGLRGAEIPLGSRIVLVCDAFSAMTTTRSYRAAMTPEDALSELVRCSGGQFDPAVVDAFCQELRAANAVCPTRTCRLEASSPVPWTATRGRRYAAPATTEVDQSMTDVGLTT